MIDSQILFGKNCLKNVKKVSTKLKGFYTAAAEKELKIPLAEYYPILCSSHFYQKCSKNDLELFNRLKIQNVANLQLLKVRGELFKMLCLESEVYFELKNINMDWLDRDIRALEDFFEARKVIHGSCGWLLEVEEFVVDDVWPVKLGR